MKVKTLKPHYYGAEYKAKGSVYFADKESGERHVRWGLCSEVKTRKRPEKKEEAVYKEGEYPDTVFNATKKTTKNKVTKRRKK